MHFDCKRDKITDRQTHWQTYLSMHWQTFLSMHWHFGIDQLFCQCIETLTYFSVNALKRWHWQTFLIMFWQKFLSVHWHIDIDRIILHRSVSLSLYPPQTKFGGVYRNHPVCLSVCLSRVNLTLAITFKTKRDMAFILHMRVPCDKTFLSVPKILTSWPWPWLLTYFWKNLTLDITF